MLSESWEIINENEMIYGTSQGVLTIQTVIEPHSPATNTHNLGDYYSWPIVTPH